MTRNHINIQTNDNDFVHFWTNNALMRKTSKNIFLGDVLTCSPFFSEQDSQGSHSVRLYLGTVTSTLTQSTAESDVNVISFTCIWS